MKYQSSVAKRRAEQLKEAEEKKEKTHFVELPPVKAMFYGNSTRLHLLCVMPFYPPFIRWSSQYEEVLFHSEYIRLIPKFFEEHRVKTDSEIVPKLIDHLDDNLKVWTILAPLSLISFNSGHPIADELCEDLPF